MNKVAPASLRSLMEQFGIQRAYRSAGGERITSSVEGVVAVLDALGVDTANIDAAGREAEARSWHRLIEPAVVAWNGRLPGIALRLSPSAARRRIEYDVQLEDGDVVSGSISLNERAVLRELNPGRARRIELFGTLRAHLPIGYHRLRVRTADGEAETLVLSAPVRCYGGDHPREWGVFAPLYALHTSERKVIGDFADLQALMSWTAQHHGDVVATLPISASFLRDPFDPSPYSPASRLFWNELYVTLDEPARADVSNLVDYRAAAEAKRAKLEPVADQFFENQGATSAPFKAFLRAYPDAQQYARFRAAGEKLGAGWPVWPERLQSGKLRAGDYDERAAHYHLYAQFRAHEQLTDLARRSRAEGVRLYLDMPLGVHPDSFDVWQNKQLFVTGASAGAPPDPFFTRGQSWGFPPMHPGRMREEGFAYWRKVLQTQLRYAGMLRLDHVMALHRLYFVPQGFDAKDGVYVRYPAEELYAVLTIESARHEAAIVGEDLGTVPAEVRKAMARHGVKRMYVVQFEATSDQRAPLSAVPARAVASLNTHDMPPFMAYWNGLDAQLRQDLGLIDAEGVKSAKTERARTVRALSQLLGARRALDAAAARTALLEWLAASKADMVLINLEDLWLEAEPQNVPGTSQERPNWRRRLRASLEELRRNDEVAELLGVVERARRNGKDT